MKTASLIVAVALALGWIPAHAQKPAAAQPAAQPEKKPAAPAAKEPAKPAADAKTAAKPVPEGKAEMKPAAKEPAKPMATASRKSRASEDARECLQLNTNSDIIKCAEKFL
jgi:hypothetical protein